MASTTTSQRVLYTGVLLLGVLVVLSGIAIWKPVQSQPLLLLFGSFQGARLVHFLCMAGFVLFLVVHVALALLVPKTLVSMVTGDDTICHPKAGASKVWRQYRGGEVKSCATILNCRASAARHVPRPFRLR